MEEVLWCMGGELDLQDRIAAAVGGRGRSGDRGGGDGSGGDGMSEREFSVIRSERLEWSR